MTKPLSPAAQAVLDAFLNGYVCKPGCNVAFEADRNGIAAAIRAVADQVVPKSEPPQRDSFSDRSVWQWAVDCHNHDTDTRSKLLAIAAELEGK
jgi:hypothetical protein